MRWCIISVLLAGLFSLSQADSVKARDGQSYQGKVEYSDADTIKLKLADSDEIRVFYASDVEEVKVDSPAAQPAPPESLPPPRHLSPEYWEHTGYSDGTKTTGFKAALAYAGAFIGGPVGGLVGMSWLPSRGDPGTGCIVGAAACGIVGCLGGSAFGSLGQQEAVSPTLDSVCRGAYRRGYKRGVRYSNNVAVGVGGAATVLWVVSMLLYWSR